MDRSAATKYIYPIVVLIGVGVAWQVGTIAFKVPVFILPSLTVIFSQGFRTSIPWSFHIATTLSETILGFVLAAVVGILLGILLTYSRPVQTSIYPLILAGQVIPKVALVPLFLIWFGYGLSSKALMTFLIAVFPIIINTSIGLQLVQPEMIELVRSFKVGLWKEFSLIRFPNALPYIFGGLEIAMTLSIIGAIVAEFAGGTTGLGYIILSEGAQFDTPLVFFSLLLIAGLGIALYAAVVLSERVFIPWHARQQKQIAQG